MSVENLVSKAIKRIGNVHPVIKQGAEEIIRQAYKKGLYVQFSDGYRSHAQQNALYAQGRTKPGPIVTNAKGGQSLHNYGLALDMFISNKEGTSASWPYDKLKQAADIAKSLGFEWGGDWKGFKDYPHIQMTGGLTLSQLQAGKKPNIKLKNVKTSTSTSKSTSSKKPSTSTSSKKSSGSIKWTKLTGKWTGQSLKLGHYGQPVKDLQNMLAKNNPPFYPDKGTKNNGIDGEYGAKTKDAVTRFQMYYGLTKDGIAGKQVYDKLNPKKTTTPKKKTATKKTTKVTAPSGTLKYGDKGKKVEQLQTALNKVYFKVGKVDGIYGNKTKDAVTRFQKVHDPYKVDGIYGARTRAKLQKLL